MFGELSESAVHAKEEVESLDIYIREPSESNTVSTGSEVGRCREAFNGAHICGYTEISVCERAVETCSVDQTEVERTIVGALLVDTPVECGAKSACA